MRQAALILAAVLAVPSWASAQDVAAGRRVAQTCQGCHGLDGISKMPGAPSLAAQDAEYIGNQLAAYKSGARQNEVMTVVAEGLTPEQIGAVAAYYAAIEVEVVRVPGR